MGRVVLFSVTRVAQSGLADTHYILGVGKIRRDTKKFDGNSNSYFLHFFKRISFEAREMYYPTHAQTRTIFQTSSLITDR